MKLTEKQLRGLIKEEARKLAEAEDTTTHVEVNRGDLEHLVNKVAEALSIIQGYDPQEALPILEDVLTKLEVLQSGRGVH